MRLAGAIGFWTALTLVTAVMGVLGAPALLFGEKTSRAVAKSWTDVALFLLKIFTGINHRIEYNENVPEKGAVVASNHQSMWETVALYNILPRPVIVLKRELTWIPVYGWFVLRTGNIAINRKAGVKAMRAMQRTAAERVSQDCQIIVFPEGTRLKPGVVAEYRPGVAGVYLASAAPCVPVAHDSGRFWRHPELAKTPGTITIRFLSPIAPGLNRDAFLGTLKAAIDGARPDLIDARKAEKMNV